MYTTVIVRPYLETTVATKNEGMRVVESIKKEINDEVKDSELVVLYHAEKRRRIIDRENTQNYKPNRWEFRIYVINKKAIKSYEQQDRTFNIKLKTLTIGI